MVGNWLIIWIEHSLFNFYTLGITVTVKSHWFPQLLPYYLLMLLLECLSN